MLIIFTVLLFFFAQLHEYRVRIPLAPLNLHANHAPLGIQNWNGPLEYNVAG